MTTAQLLFRALTPIASVVPFCDFTSFWLLLRALTPIASQRQRRYKGRIHFCSVHSHQLLRCLSGRSGFRTGLLLRALTPIASGIKGKPTNSEFLLLRALTPIASRCRFTGSNATMTSAPCTHTNCFGNDLCRQICLDLLLRALTPIASAKTEKSL